jgi:hypothetical protein
MSASGADLLQTITDRFRSSSDTLRSLPDAIRKISYLHRSAPALQDRFSD